jgi:uncharacterized DUF497 family protein
MRFEWDRNKAVLNRQKHGVDLSDAVSVLEDPLALTICEVVSGEQRYVSMGMDILGRLLVVAYTIRGDRIRLISARKADKLEQRQYEEMT